MKTFEFKLPDIGEGVTEGEIVKWLIAPGDPVQEDQPIVEVMTDKATVTITSPRTGKVLETRGDVGGIVPVHAVLVVFDLGSGMEASPAAASVGNAEPAATAVGDIRESLPGMEYLQAPEARVNHGSNGHAKTQNYFNEKPLATPATRALARDLGIDLRGVRPTGRHQGRRSCDGPRAGDHGPRDRGAHCGARAEVQHHEPLAFGHASSEITSGDAVAALVRAAASGHGAAG
jgi:pyruvate dehydrogenase E2 component (dihydrolipoamide acetyltransferase)